MMDSIAAASMSMSQMEFENAYNIAVMKKSMNIQAEQMQAFTEMLYALPTPTPLLLGLGVSGCAPAGGASAPPSLFSGGCHACGKKRPLVLPGTQRALDDYQLFSRVVFHATL